MKTAIIGIGNPTLTDDGVGICAANEISELLKANVSYDKEYVEVITLCVGGIRLMETMVGVDRCIVLDAVETKRVPPGSIIDLDINELRLARNVTSSHDMGLLHALELGKVAGLKLPDEVYVLGVEALDVTTFSEELTPLIKESLPKLIERAVELLKQVK